MKITEALDIIDDVRINLSQGLLETLMIMGETPDAFSDTEMVAYRRVMVDFRKLLAPKEDSNESI